MVELPGDVRSTQPAADTDQEARGPSARHLCKLRRACKRVVFRQLIGQQKRRVAARDEVLEAGRRSRDHSVAPTRDEMCSRVAVVAQDAALFDESVAYNIAYGALPPPPAPPSPSRLFLRDPEPLDAILAAPRPDVVAAARRAAVHETVLQLPGGRGYDTKVGERGAALSGGERQRVAIARALMRGADALLADEPTSAADAETEAALIASLRRTAAGGGAVVSPATGGGSATLVVVAHRLASVACADRIVVMESGRVAEMGTHAELLARRGGLYARLWALQQGETEEDENEPSEEVGVRARGARVDGEAATP